MVLLHNQPPKLAIIAGKLVMSTGCTDVIGGTLTCGTPDNATSGLLTWAPAFNYTPVIFASINSGAEAATTSPSVRFTGVGVSTGYITLGATPSSGCTIGVVIMGEAAL